MEPFMKDMDSKMKSVDSKNKDFTSKMKDFEKKLDSLDVNSKIKTIQVIYSCLHSNLILDTQGIVSDNLITTTCFFYFVIPSSKLSELELVLRKQFMENKQNKELIL